MFQPPTLYHLACVFLLICVLAVIGCGGNGNPTNLKTNSQPQESEKTVANSIKTSAESNPEIPTNTKFGKELDCKEFEELLRKNLTAMINQDWKTYCEGVTPEALRPVLAGRIDYAKIWFEKDPVSMEKLRKLVVAYGIPKEVMETDPTKDDTLIYVHFVKNSAEFMTAVEDILPEFSKKKPDSPRINIEVKNAHMEGEKAVVYEREDYTSKVKGQDFAIINVQWVTFVRSNGLWQIESRKHVSQSFGDVH